MYAEMNLQKLKMKMMDEWSLGKVEGNRNTASLTEFISKLADQIDARKNLLKLLQVCSKKNIHFCDRSFSG